jgi:hypothetical protein
MPVTRQEIKMIPSPHVSSIMLVILQTEVEPGAALRSVPSKNYLVCAQGFTIWRTSRAGKS